MPCFSFNANQKGICLQNIGNIEFHINNLGDNTNTAINDVRMNQLTSQLACLLTHSLTHTHAHTHSLTHTHAHTHSFIHSFIHSFTYLLTHSLTHSCPVTPRTSDCEDCPHTVRGTRMVTVVPVTFEVPKALIIKVTVLWDVKSCRLVDRQHAEHWQLSTEPHGVTTQNSEI